MGSDWTWALRLHGDHDMTAVVSDFFEIAQAHGLSMRNELGSITVWDNEAEPAFVVDHAEALESVAAGTGNITMWLGEVDIFTHCRLEPDRAGDGIDLHWYLNSCWCYRKPVAEADDYRLLHQQLTAMWAQVADTFGAVHGRIEDEWSVEQIWRLTDLMDYSMSPGVWPSWLGWWTYLGAELVSSLPKLPLPELEQHLHLTTGGGQILQLLEDPAAVDPARYERLHKLWLAALPAAA